MSVDIDRVNGAANSGQGVVETIATRVLKQTQDSQKQLASSIVQMIDQSTSQMAQSAKTLKTPGLGEKIDIKV